MKSSRNNQNSEANNAVNENAATYLQSKSEIDRLREAVYMSDMDKFRLFTNMLRTNALFRRAVITHKK